MQNECEEKNLVIKMFLAWQRNRKRVTCGCSTVTKQTGYLDEGPIRWGLGDHGKEFRFYLKDNGNLLEDVKLMKDTMFLIALSFSGYYMESGF